MKGHLPRPTVSPLGHRGKGDETYPVGAVALEDSRICFVDNQTIYDVLMNNPAITYSMMMFYSEELRKCEQRGKYSAQMTVEEKVISALVYINDTFHENGADTPCSIRMSRKEIAQIAGTNTDQVSRVLSFLKSQGDIKTDGRAILVTELRKLRKRISKYHTWFQL